MKQERPYLRGVGLLLLSSNIRLLVLKELESKPQSRKQAGMLSFPLETLEVTEAPINGIARLIKEEVDHAQVGNIFALQQLGEYHFTHPGCDVIIHAYQARASHEFEAQPADSDVEHFGWIEPALLIAYQHVRLEVTPIIHALLSQNLHVAL